eukprot:366101-Chlamydomonas_euryale.AAC.9
MLEFCLSKTSLLLPASPTRSLHAGHQDREERAWGARRHYHVLRDGSAAIIAPRGGPRAATQFGGGGRQRAGQGVRGVAWGWGVGGRREQGLASAGEGEGGRGAARRMLVCVCGPGGHMLRPSAQPT